MHKQTLVSRLRRLSSQWGAVLLALASTALSGCGGGGGGATLAPAAVNETGTFYSSPVKVLVGQTNLVTIGRGFVTLNQRVPTAVGIELTEKAVRDLPAPLEAFRDVYGLSLPPESTSTIFTHASLYHWSGHPPASGGDVRHYHVYFGLYPPQQPIAANPFQIYRDPAPAAIPADHIRATGPDAMEVDIGVAFRDPNQPMAQPDWNSTGQDYYFYNGHMNAITVAATRDFLTKQKVGQEPSRSDVIKQPQVYPKPGHYPHRYTVSYNSARGVHLFVLEDFRPATTVMP